MRVTTYETKFSTDIGRATKIGKRLLDQFYSRTGYFEGYEMPEYDLPDGLVAGSREHACYLTFVISIDYMTDAVKLWHKARGTYRMYPERFDPATIVKLGERTLTSFTRELGARYPKSAAVTWKKIAEVLLAKSNGDPRNITPQPLTINEIKTKLKDFPYLRGNKLSNFYLRAMAEKKLLKIADFDQLDIPVDIQVARFTVYTGVLRILSESFEGCVHNKPLSPMIEGIWRDAGKELGSPPWKLDEPIWTIGSKLCAKWACNHCPVEDLCDKVKGARIKEDRLIWQRS